MITTAAALVALVSAPTSPVQSQGSQFVSKMLKYYAGAQSMTGTITYTATDGAGKAQLITYLQYEKPSKLSIKQVKSGSNPMTWLLASDGKNFTYPSPEHLISSEPGSAIGKPGTKRRQLVEPVYQIIPNEFITDAKGNKVQKKGNLDIRQIYAVGAPSIADRSAPLDIAIGRVEDLQHVNLQWMTVEYSGRKSHNGVEVHVVTGGWRNYGNMAVRDPKFPPGHYQMLIADDGKLLQYSVRQLMQGNAVLQETWDVDLTVNGQTDPSAFKLGG